jgi:hypothetical protein
MPKFIIEREIPGAGSLTVQDLQGISQKSCGVLSDGTENSVAGKLCNRR